MKFSVVLASLRSFFTVSRCICCGATVSSEDFLCRACLSFYEEERAWECGMCGKKLSECTCVNADLERALVRRAVKLLRYRPDKSDAVGNRLVYRLKRHNVSRIRTFLGKELAEALRKNIVLDDSFAVSYVVRSLRQKRMYGFDQGEELARVLASELSLPLLAPLERKKKSRVQKHLAGADARRANVKGSFLPKEGVSLKGKRILLVDDIVTTGASMAECARVLRQMGAKEIVAVSVSIAYRQPNIKYEHDENTHEERFWLKK